LQFSEVIATLAIAVVAAAAGQRYAAKRLPGDLDVFLAFLPFAIVGLLTFLPDAETLYAEPWVLVLLYVQPVLFARLVRHVGKSWAIPGVVAAIGGVASIALALQNPELFTEDTAAADASLGLIMASVAAFLIPNLWVGVQFARAAAQSAGVTKVRLTWASFSAFLFIASLMTYSVPPDSPAAIVGDFVSLVLALAFLLGFAPPNWVQRAWRSTAYVQFVKATEGIEATASDEEVDRRLLEATRGVLDSTAIRFSAAPGGPEALTSPTGASGHRAFLVASFSGPRLFRDDDQTTLNALAGQCRQFLEPRERLLREAEARQAAEEQAAFKASFLRHFGHEVANPLSPLRIQVKLLEQESAGKGTHRFEIIDRSIRRMEEIIADVSAVAMAIDPRAPRKVEEVDLAEVVREAVRSYVEAAQGGQCSLAVESAGPCAVSCDRTRVMQAVDNLLSNAIKYSPQGGSIRVSVAPRGDGVLVEVVDHGLGFDSEQGKRLFQTYSRVHREVAPGIPGSGLGLYLVQEVAHVHGGKATAASAGPGKGSTFAVWLPRAPPAQLGMSTFRA
jgi:signal transduction histidine kinase